VIPFYTVGHSTRDIDSFIHLLRMAGVTAIADIRSIPRSRTNPQYNADVLPDTLASFHIDYVLIPELGGRRNKSKLKDDLNGFWENDSFKNYADYALTPAFQDGLEKLIALGRCQRCAMMCSEAVWWRCHRRIVADYLIARDETVIHLMDKGKQAQASLTKGAVLQDQKVIYPASTVKDAG
jgi:uncharacterized protein (DUF488 family)